MVHSTEQKKKLRSGITVAQKTRATTATVTGVGGLGIFSYEHNEALAT